MLANDYYNCPSVCTRSTLIEMTVGLKFFFMNLCENTFPWDDLVLSFGTMLDETNEFGQNLMLKREMQDILKNKFYMVS